MKLKNSFFYTLRNDSKDEDSISSNLLVKSGMIKKISSGVYAYMPLGYKALMNVENIIREEMNKQNAQELLMTTLIPNELIEKSGRDLIFGKSIFRLKDRFDKKYILGPTHEEMFSLVAGLKINSYKDLPFNIYQFQTKFRDEARPRYGLIRVREFIMKDAYSFDINEEEMDKSYKKMDVAYHNSFDRMKINYKVVKADTGAMGGLLSEEFQAITDIGEDTVVLCDSCNYSSNIEVSRCVNKKIDNDIKELDKELIYTPNAKTIEEVSTFLNENKDKFVKTLIYKIEDEFYAFLLNGDDNLNETKVLKLLNKLEMELASFDDVLKLNSFVGFAGPINLNIKIIIDEKVSYMKNFITGSNKENYHYKNVNLKDFNIYKIADIRNIKENDICPICGGRIHFKKGIEIGNIFKLGNKYSKAFNLQYLDQNNKLNYVEMGCYGIGIGRCLAAIVEQNHDDKGIIWPIEVAPYKVAIVVININDENQLSLANKLYDLFNDKNIDVILDDRDLRAGVKFNDMDLIGIPYRITVGRKALDNIIEFKKRDSNDVIEIDLNKDNILNYIKLK